MSYLDPITLTLRIEKGSVLTHLEGDNNFKNLKAAVEQLDAVLQGIFDEDGNLKDGTVGTGSILNRAVTESKIAYDYAKFYVDESAVVNTVRVNTPTGDDLDYTEHKKGTHMFVEMAQTNDGNVTMDVGQAPDAPLKRHGSKELEPGDLVQGKVSEVIYDGTQFVLLNPQSQESGILFYDINPAFDNSGDWNNSLMEMVVQPLDEDGNNVKLHSITAMLRCKNAWTDEGQAYEEDDLLSLSSLQYYSAYTITGPAEIGSGYQFISWMMRGSKIHFRFNWDPADSIASTQNNNGSMRLAKADISVDPDTTHSIDSTQLNNFGIRFTGLPTKGSGSVTIVT